MKVAVLGAINDAVGVDVDRTDGIVIRPRITRRRDRVRLSGQVAMADAALSLPPQFTQMAIAAAVDDVMDTVMRREPARRAAGGLRCVDQAGEVIMADCAEHPAEGADVIIAAAEDQYDLIVDRIEIGERVAVCIRRAGTMPARQDDADRRVRCTPRLCALVIE